MIIIIKSRLLFPKPAEQIQLSKAERNHPIHNGLKIMKPTGFPIMRKSAVGIFTSTNGRFATSENRSWYYGDERIKVLIDSEKKLVYQTDENGTYLSVVRNEDNIAEIKKISEAEAKDLMKENNPQDNGELTTEE